MIPLSPGRRCRQSAKTVLDTGRNTSRHSWSTGDRRGDGVTSHYQRLARPGSAITGRNHNDAISGAGAAQLPDQPAMAVKQNAEYVTILVGANDLCASSAAKTEAQRQLVVAREAAFNRILARACSEYRNCRWDNNAVNGFRFPAGDVSKLDYFHPSLEGQARLAALTWQASWWGSRP